LALLSVVVQELAESLSRTLNLGALSICFEDLILVNVILDVLCRRDEPERLRLLDLAHLKSNDGLESLLGFLDFVQKSNAGFAVLIANNLN